MATRIETLAAALPAALGDKLAGVDRRARRGHRRRRGRRDLDRALRLLRDRPELRFEMLIDLCGVDYSTYGDGAREGPRFAVVYHLLSLANNWRLRVRAFAPDDAFPVIAERDRRLAGGELVRARGVRPLRHRVQRASRTCAAS